ncbi:PIN domain-containing protein [Desulfosarcina sp. OttesenSCG-928-G10]|nr:PIN domain-containing protein [Desulfosarcina sp. OttesenSCG-928-G10]
MLQYMLDTNICIYLIKSHPPSVAQKFNVLRKGEVAVSAISWGELCCGLDIKNSRTQMDELSSKLVLMPYDHNAAFIFGMLSQRFPNRKSSFDRMIAAHAISLGITLVTNNTTDFLLYTEAGLNLLWRSSPLAVERSVCSAVDIINRQGFDSAAFPLIGAGTGGLAKTDVTRLMIKTVEKCDVTAEIIISVFGD